MHDGAGGCHPKSAAADGLTPEWEDALRGAYEAGAGRGPLDPDDDDLQDAARLASPVGEGGILWHPATLDDIYAIPARTLLLFDHYRLGMVSRQMPFTWRRTKGKRVTAHQYASDWQGEADRPARCGFDPGEVELESSDIAKCVKCEKLDKGESVEATGTVAGVRVGARDSQGLRHGRG